MSFIRSLQSILIVLAWGVSLSTGCSCSDSGGLRIPFLPGSGSRSLSERFPLDGSVDFSALQNISTQTVQFYELITENPAHTTVVTWAMTNDDREIYMAFEWNDDDNDADWDIDGPNDYDAVLLLMDSNGNGTYENGDDKKGVLAALEGSHYIDTVEGIGDIPPDIIGDGKAFVKYHADRDVYQAEFILPLEADVRGDDAEIDADLRYNAVFFDHTRPATGEGYAGSLSPDMEDTTGWSTFTIEPSKPLDLPGIPTDLPGTIVFISKHETERGGLYTFNPRTKAVSRISSSNPSDLDDLNIDGVNLSHDRTRVAFMGWTDAGGITSADVYVMNLDGSGFTNLTNAPATLEGHAAWSPDDERLLFIQYASGPAHIFTIDADGGSSPVDITGALDGYENNDPEWLPDGRVLFKTSYWTPWAEHPNELRVAVMNEDGSGLTQISHGDEVVDHDPISDGEWTAWERLNGPWDYVTDIRSYFSPWDILEARLNGTDQHILVHDVWVNWLPVYDPSGNYIVYLKGCGYTESRLITRKGEDLGRFIPDMTMIQYLDWK